MEETHNNIRRVKEGERDGEGDGQTLKTRSYWSQNRETTHSKHILNWP